MLEIQNVSKTFNAGTVNEKTALNGLNLKLNELRIMQYCPNYKVLCRERS